MKRILTLFLFFGLFLYVSAQEEYYIEGFYQRHGDLNYTLTKVHTQGITIDGKTDFPDEIFSGEKVQLPNCRNGLDATMIRFSFEKVVINCKTWKDLRFQYWDEDNNKWKDDVEACMGESKGVSQKDMVMMLVLDYSSSMDNLKDKDKNKNNKNSNIYRMKNMAVEFINSMSKMSTGNLHVGIIAFAGMDRATHQIFPITPLTEGNKSKFEEFIKTSTMGTETALYYSMDNAIKKIEDYVSDHNFTQKNFNGTCMITFTDGLDNASINDNISLTMHRGSKNEYLTYLNGLLKGQSRKMILEMPLENFAIGFTGSENFTSEDMKLFEDVLQRTTPDSAHFKIATRFEEVEEYFKYIISQLTERWQTLNVYVGEAQHGKVRWVLECGDAPKKEKDAPKKEKTKRDFLICPLFGLNVGGGGGYSKPTQFIEFSAGLDLAFACSPKFALGLYGSYKGTFQTIHQGAFGLDFMIGSQQKAFLLGLGVHTLLKSEKIDFIDMGLHVDRYRNFHIGGDMRLGGVFKGFYFFFDLSVGPYYFIDYLNNGYSYERTRILPQATFNIGINFTQLGKKNKNNKKKE